MRWLTSSACGGRHLLHAASGPHVLVVETRHAQHHEKPPRHQSACLSRRRLHHAAHVVRTGVSGSRLPHKRGGASYNTSWPASLRSWISTVTASPGLTEDMDDMNTSLMAVL
uniref:Uncharacterized protein n=1 Tax=Oryza sativa subsp. japonica TaxID=39947 RepID=Q9FWV9_ORYSJ|nr:hypothetical protein [Oryza sativa Japonica Group]